KRRELERQLRAGARADVSVAAGDVEQIDGVKVVLQTANVDDPKAMPDVADRLRNQLGDPAVVVLGADTGGRVSLLVAATPGAVERGVRAGAIARRSRTPWRLRGRRSRRPSGRERGAGGGRVLASRSRRRARLRRRA